MPEITADQLAARGGEYPPPVGTGLYRLILTGSERDHLIAALREHESRAAGFWATDGAEDEVFIVGAAVYSTVSLMGDCVWVYKANGDYGGSFPTKEAAKAAVEKAVRNG